MSDEQEVSSPQPSISVAPEHMPTQEPVSEAPDHSEQTAEETQEQKPQTKTFTQEELDKVVSKRLSKAERAWERKHQQLLETALTSRQPAAQEQPQNTGLAEPDPHSFTDYSDYMRAMARYEAATLIQNTVHQAEQQRTVRSQQERQAILATNMQRQAEAASDKYDDFDEVVRAPDLAINDVMAEVIAESDVGGELAYYLGKNKEEAAKISALSPLQAAKALARLEDKIEQTLKAAKETSKAPAPIDPVKARATADKDPSQMTDSEFDAWRRKQIQQRRNR